jgi:hypothetical protein
MSNPVSHDITLFGNGTSAPLAPIVMMALAAWLGVVVVLGAISALAGPPGQPPLPVFASAVVPLVLFAVAWRTSLAFREFLLALDIRLITAAQAWRYAGFGFLALYTNHVLPGLFAWPAGLGDMAIAVAAPLWILRLSENPEAIRSRGFRLWNALGILDFVIAFTTATISSMTLVTDRLPSMGPMTQLPLVLIPAFMVPLFTMLHIVALMQSKQAIAESR